MSKFNCIHTRDGGVDPIAFREDLLSLFTYDPSTGLFWHKRGKFRGRVAGTLTRRGYVRLKVGAGRSVFAHRAAWLLTCGDWPGGVIDHRNGVRDDNRIVNLRDVDQSINTQNMRATRSDNRVGFTGVSRRRNTYQVRISVEGKTRHVGMFATPEEAHAAYLDAKATVHV